MAFKPENFVLIGRLSLDRELPEDQTQAVKDFAAPVGEAIWAWNYCHAAFANLFNALVAPHNLAIGNAIWHNITGDRNQRSLILAVAKAILRDDEDMLNNIEWSKKAADDLSMIRNDAAHLATGFSTHLPETTVVPDIIGTAPKRLNRIKDADLIELFSTLYGDLISLSGYVRILTSTIQSGKRDALPEKPVLRSIQK